jgi:hypothetical protein
MLTTRNEHTKCLAIEWIDYKNNPKQNPITHNLSEFGKYASAIKYQLKDLLESSLADTFDEDLKISKREKADRDREEFKKSMIQTSLGATVGLSISAILLHGLRAKTSFPKNNLSTITFCSAGALIGGFTTYCYTNTTKETKYEIVS